MSIRLPAEWEPHSCCWMSWAVHREWDKATAHNIKRDLFKVVQTVADYEPVRLLAPSGPALREAQQRFEAFGNVTVTGAPVDDFWMRDIMPTFALRGRAVPREIVAIDWNFNGWGGTEERPRRAGDRLAKVAASIFGVPRVSTSFVAEGGALVTDGCGTLITTRSCLLNPNRNPPIPNHDPQRMIEKELSKLGVSNVIWLEGDPCEPITGGHTDGYVLCAPDGVVLVETIDDSDVEPPLWREHDIALLESTCDAVGRKFRIVRVRAPRMRYWQGNPGSFAPCYLNVYVANGAVIGGRFGDPERDEAARTTLAKAFRGRDIVMLDINHIANGGGGVRCLTQPMIRG